ncbi:hypothetical protein Goshw_001242 [Gossypium schwendimanii]|uniref:RNase H type-1 domain-containing protein n=1 Tax=Gossypium schwendimanii TaxID=34291 RepID=A0A7J9KVU3_GOSSC|nr:hypothetical protein [Gossypium schwendimanii]
MVINVGDWNLDLFRLWLPEKGLGHNMACGVWGHISEDVLHAIRDFPVVCNIWNQLFPVGKHDRNQVCLNIDGVRHEVGFVAAGGIVQDHNGKWLFGFNRLEAAKDIRESSVKGSNSTLLWRIHQLLLRFGCWSICHIHREDNQDVDSLVNMVHERRHRLLMFKVSSFKRRS